jgi:hypothetical protein
MKRVHKRKSTASKPAASQDGRSLFGPIKLCWILHNLLPMFIAGRRVSATLVGKRAKDLYMQEVYRRITVVWFKTFGYSLPYKTEPELFDKPESDNKDERIGAELDDEPQWALVAQPAVWSDADRLDCFGTTCKVSTSFGLTRTCPIPNYTLS